MSVYDVAKDKPGVGPIHARIIRLIRDGNRHPKQIAARLSDYAGQQNLKQVLGGLVARGYIAKGRGHVYTLTDKALEFLPKAQMHPWQLTTYKPPVAPPRRPGSDHSYIPSVAADKFYDYIKHV